MKVLVIEDDPSLREIICRSLEKERYVTEEAPDFQTALEKTADYTYDCILLDIMLPDGNGLDLLEIPVALTETLYIESLGKTLYYPESWTETARICWKN